MVTFPLPIFVEQNTNKMTYTLNVKETGNKSAKFHYTVTDENGVVISERNSNRVYEACTINGAYYFGRRDLVGKGDHGKTLKMNSHQLADDRMVGYATIAYKK